jgi:hypothetical protein
MLKVGITNMPDTVWSVKNSSNQSTPQYSKGERTQRWIKDHSLPVMLENLELLPSWRGVIAKSKRAHAVTDNNNNNNKGVCWGREYYISKGETYGEAVHSRLLTPLHTC